MNLWQSIKKAFAQPPENKPGNKPAPAPVEWPEPEEMASPAELAPAQVQAALASVQPPLLLDVREQYEWEQVRIPAALHIPMNEVPHRLGELPRTQPIVVFCAHGSRSFGVASYLLEQGFDAANLSGGITQWRIKGGTVQTGGQ
jgi:rhodanese-related sulfurtransferase